MNTRSTTSGIRYAKATINGVPGLIILPDSWSTSIYSLNFTNTASAAYTTNIISSSQWATLENSGCAFLPAAGGRNGVSVFGGGGCYWSATNYGSDYAYAWRFSSSYLDPSNYNRYLVQSVRLVKDAN